MREILYIPSGEIVRVLTGEKHTDGNPQTIPVSKYIADGIFKEEFHKYDFWDKEKEPYDLFLSFLVGEVREEGDLIFCNFIYSNLKISDEYQNKLTRSEFEIVNY